MVKFSNILENYMKQNLVKVKIKVDPANVKGGSISKYNGYEGFILAETPEKTKICLENSGIILTVPSNMVDVCDNQYSKVDLFRIKTIKYLTKTYNIDKEDPIIAVILTAKSIEAIEQYILVDGYDKDDVLNIYKEVLAEYE